MWLLIHKAIRVHYALKTWGYIDSDKCADSSFSVSPKFVYYPFSDSQSSTATSLSSYLIATIIYWCWFARNCTTFQNSVLTSSKIIALIKNDVSVRIRGDRPDSIRNFWSFRNILCAISPDSDLDISFFPLL